MIFFQGLGLLLQRFVILLFFLIILLLFCLFSVLSLRISTVFVFFVCELAL